MESDRRGETADGEADAILAADFDTSDLPQTGDPRVDEVLGRLRALSGASVADQVAIYDEVQRGLAACLAEAGQAPPSRADRPG